MYDYPETSKSTSVQMRNSIFGTTLDEIKAAVSMLFFLSRTLHLIFAPASFKTSSQRSSFTWWGPVTPNQSWHSRVGKKQDTWLIYTMLNKIKAAVSVFLFNFIFEAEHFSSYWDPASTKHLLGGETNQDTAASLPVSHVVCHFRKLRPPEESRCHAF